MKIMPVNNNTSKPQKQQAFTAQWKEITDPRKRAVTFVSFCINSPEYKKIFPLELYEKMVSKLRAGFDIECTEADLEEVAKAEEMTRSRQNRRP